MPRSCPCPPSTGDAATCDVFETGRLSTLLSSVDPGDGADVGKPPKPLLIASPTGEGEYPVLILLHGYLLSNSFYSQLLQHIASHGFILVAPQVLIPVSVSCSDPSPTLLLPGNFNSCTRWPDRTQPKRSNPQRQSQIGCREAFQPFFPRKSPPIWLSWLSPATAGEARQPSPWPWKRSPPLTRSLSRPWLASIPSMEWAKGTKPCLLFLRTSLVPSTWTCRLWYDFGAKTRFCS